MRAIIRPWSALRGDSGHILQLASSVKSCGDTFVLFEGEFLGEGLRQNMKAANLESLSKIILILASLSSTKMRASEAARLGSCLIYMMLVHAFRLVIQQRKDNHGVQLSPDLNQTSI